MSTGNLRKLKSPRDSTVSFNIDKRSSRDDKEEEPSISTSGIANALAKSPSVSQSRTGASPLSNSGQRMSSLESFHFTGPELQSPTTRHSKVFRYSKEGSPYCSVKMLALSVHNAPPPEVPLKSCMASSRKTKVAQGTNLDPEERSGPCVQWIDRVHTGRKLAEYPPSEEETWSFLPSPAVVQAEKIAVEQVNRLRAREIEESKDDRDATCRQCDDCTIA